MRRWMWILGAAVLALTGRHATAGVLPTGVGPFAPLEPKAPAAKPLYAPEGEDHDEEDTDAFVDDGLGDLEVLLTLHHVAQVHIGHAQAAQQCAASAPVRGYARRLLREQRSVDKRIVSLLRKRLGDLDERDLAEIPARPGDGELACGNDDFDEQFLLRTSDQHERTSLLLAAAAEATGDAPLQDFLAKLLVAARKQKSDADRLLHAALHAAR